MAKKRAEPPVNPDDLVSPHSLEAERAALGAVLVDPALWPKAITAVTADEFFRSFHAAAWRAIGQCVERGVSIDLITVAEALKASPADRAYLAGLVDGVPRATNIAHYAGIVREKAILRSAAAVGRTITEGACQGEPAREVIDAGLRQLADLVRATGTGPVQATDVVTAYVDGIVNGTMAPAVPTGYLDLDALTGGLRRGDLVIVAGRPSVGKSSLGLGIARNVAQQDLAAYFSLEMADWQLAARLLSWESGVSSQRFERGTATQDDYRRISDAMARLAPSLMIETSAQSVAEVGAWCRSMVSQGLACAVVDYLQLLRAEHRRDSDEAEVASISRALKRLAKDLGIVVVALSQLNRAPEGRKDKRPTTADLRGSGALEQDCDMALLLFREEMHTPTDENRGIAEIIVAKNRTGPTGVVRAVFMAELAQFANLAPESIWGAHGVA